MYTQKDVECDSDAKAPQMKGKRIIMTHTDQPKTPNRSCPKIEDNENCRV